MCINVFLDFFPFMSIYLCISPLPFPGTLGRLSITGTPGYIESLPEHFIPFGKLDT